MAAPKWQPARDFGDLHMILMQLPFADGLAVSVPRRCERRGDERKDVRCRDGVEVLMADDFQSVADHRVEGF
ncbi:hypothetical protein [Bradyrhizobium valentinum]|uniref:hypothetical protein n=1 Tax=Bradyrhizobium valentinum TaxID=1518501 RepID=UPI0012E3407F|nr:hypothetical protein [Bradyrhizobium valentinum]